ncbi:hypothetical protein CPLU01_01612 [Colletotrichum plurivorum]|uniref:Uncharacterized protein n=1 Tax=Colletotrichum plurivorum TaxID=2175906 RepID=A0A8H6KY66_9PEZI|nr:hypothetical protein CPLU01_01612 [Colletotrichum plurivorum]
MVLSKGGWSGLERETGFPRAFSGSIGAATQTMDASTYAYAISGTQVPDRGLAVMFDEPTGNGRHLRRAHGEAGGIGNFGTRALFDGTSRFQAREKMKVSGESKHEPARDSTTRPPCFFSLGVDVVWHPEEAAPGLVVGAHPRPMSKSAESRQAASHRQLFSERAYDKCSQKGPAGSQLASAM